MKFPLFPKRKADAVANGVFLILLGVLFLTGHLWPGILFAVGLSLALRQYLTGRRLDFLVTTGCLGLLGFLTLVSQAFSSLFPVLFIVAGLYLVAKELFLPQFLHARRQSPPNNRDFRD